MTPIQDPTPTVWQPAPVPAAAAVLEAAGLSGRLAGLLARRGVETPEDAERFLDPSEDHLHDGAGLAGLPEAVERLAAAKERGETVAIVGDYDVDGVTGTALLAAVLRACGLSVETILPRRLTDGYGFQPVHVERAREAGAQLVVTVDCGTTSTAAVGEALAAGLDVVVTDHHLPGELPEGVVQINPHREDCSYPFGGLSGVGLALKLAVATAERLGRGEITARRLLRMACLGTIADLVPLVGENRTIAALGLQDLPTTRSPGLKALLDICGLKRGKAITASDVGFRIGPRINAVGRLDDAALALEMLLTTDGARGRELAQRLDQLNRERQRQERQVVDEARAMVEARAQELGALPGILVAWSPDWHRGVVGIAAGRLARRFHRPTVLLAVDSESDQAVGSGRSIPAIDLHGFLSEQSEKGGELARFGGHAQAIGLTVAPEPLGRLPELRERWEAAAAQAFTADDLARRHLYELELPAWGVGDELLGELARLEPHGQGNARPLLKVGPLEIATPPRRFGKAGSGRHLELSCRAADGGGSVAVSMVGWGWGERLDGLAAALEGHVEVLGHLEHDDYRNRPVLRLVDLRPLSPGADRPVDPVE